MSILIKVDSPWSVIALNRYLSGSGRTAGNKESFIINEKTLFRYFDKAWDEVIQGTGMRSPHPDEVFRYNSVLKSFEGKEFPIVESFRFEQYETEKEFTIQEIINEFKKMEYNERYMCTEFEALEILTSITLFKSALNRSIMIYSKNGIFATDRHSCTGTFGGRYVGISLYYYPKETDIIVPKSIILIKERE
jgi:hypothetical protein